MEWHYISAFTDYCTVGLDMDHVLESHRQATVVRCALSEVVLAIQDTTAINYDMLKKVTGGLTEIGKTAKRIYAHANVAFYRVTGVSIPNNEFRRSVFP